MSGLSEPLLALARHCGIQPEYWTIDGDHKEAGADVLLTILQRLGHSIRTVDDAPAVLAAVKRADWAHLLEPVVLVTNGQPGQAELRLPADAEVSEASARVMLENGGEVPIAVDPAALPVNREEILDGTGYVARALPLPGGLPTGYHRLHVTVGEMTGEALLISAPGSTWMPEGGSPRHWGVFLPLYALRTARSHAVGDLTDLGALAGWVSERGGQVVATLPILAAFLGCSGAEHPFEPSPYTPASRLFWNELFIDLDAVPELADCAAARERLADADWQHRAKALADAQHLDYRAAATLRREVLCPLARHFAASATPERRAAFERFRADATHLDDYAAFRAVCEKRGESWHCWPEPLKSGRLTESDYDRSAFEYHRFVQFEAARQVSELAARARKHGAGLYVDQPLGVHPDSFDLWRLTDLYCPGISLGAPPDPLATDGQDWGIPPLHPDRLRASGYRYWIDSLRHVMRMAGILRIDHVMQLHRLFWIPSGEPGSKGVYVSYRADELWAIVCLESHRHHTMIVGEDLGTVPDEVRNAMDRHNAAGMSVMQFEIRNDETNALTPVSAHRVASVNTHDTPTWAGFCAGHDIDVRVELGWLAADGAAREREYRGWLIGALGQYFRNRGLMTGDADPGNVLDGALRWLAMAPTRLTLVTLEDLWLEPEPQNVPGTWREKPNWQRRARLRLEQFADDPTVLGLLDAVNTLRTGGPAV